MNNKTIAAVLDEMADLLELDDANPFKIRAFRRASEAVQNASNDVTTLDRKTVLAIPGIGKGVADLIDEIKRSARVAEHEALKRKYPAGVLAMMSLSGLGPKRAAFLFKECKIDSIDRLKKAAERGDLGKLPRFGEKLQNQILRNIQTASAADERRLITLARAEALAFLEYLRAGTGARIDIAGSLRRWRETVGDVDFIATGPDPEAILARFKAYPLTSRVLASGPTKISLVVASGLQFDLRVVPAASHGAALLYFTGSKSHNVRLRELALKKGFTLNEYGLFRLSDKKKAKPIAGKTEEDVYRALGLAWIPPELREDQGEIEAARNNALPDLIEMSDVRGDFHNHTELSDGRDTMEAMVAAAAARGWEWYFCGDHSPSLTIASGLSVEALRKKAAELRRLNRNSKDIGVFLGSEVDILADGRMDYPDDALARVDCVVASVHSRFRQSKAEMTERICRAIRHPHVDIVGHLTGRRIHRREPYDVDVDQILRTAAESGTAIEVNGQPERQELEAHHVRRAVELGVPIAVDTDAHGTRELDHMELAVHIARRGWAEKKHVLNALSKKDILAWLEK